MGGSTAAPCSILHPRRRRAPVRSAQSRPRRTFADAGSPAAKEDRHAHGSIHQPDPSARHETALPQVVRCGRRRGGWWRVLVDRSDRPSNAGRRPGRHADQARRHLDAGEPLVRPLLRLRAVDRRLRPARRLHPARRLRRDRRAVPLREPRDARHPARLGLRPRPVGRRRDGRLLHECRASGRSATTQAPTCRSTTASTRTRRCASTSSARCSGRPGRTASISWPGRRAGSRPTACGATASSTTR